MPEAHLQRIIEGTEDPGVLHDAAELARHKARRATALFGTALLVVVFLALVSVLFELNVASISRDKADRATERLITLQETNIAKAKCALQFEAQQRRSSFQYLGRLGQLVIVISTVPQADPSRRDQIAAAVGDLQRTLMIFEDATKQLNDWAVLPPEKQLPCPLG